MRRAPAGYTIVEVMIFLAVSAFLMAAAMNLIRGKQAQVDFTQKLRDTQSQLQSWISDVSSGFPGTNPGQDHCVAPSNGQPILYTGAPPSNGTYTPTCVFLGKAIQFPPVNGSDIYAYSVFGNNAYNGNLPIDLAQSRPEPAIGQHGVDLTEPFNMYPLYTKKLVACKGVNSASCNSYLLGFYNSINSESTPAGNNENELNVYQYPFSGTPSNQDNSTVQNCLEMILGGPCPSSDYPDKLQYVKYCLTDGDRTAQLSITSSAGLGATVQIDYINC